MIIPVVAAIIQSNDEYGKVLLTKRKSIHIETNNRWEFPGGVVEDGERLEDALMREIKEELNLDITVCPICYARINEYDYSEDRFLIMFYACFPVDPLCEDKLPEHIWVTLEDIAHHSPLLGAVEALRNIKP